MAMGVIFAIYVILRWVFPRAASELTIPLLVLVVGAGSIFRWLEEKVLEAPQYPSDFGRVRSTAALVDLFGYFVLALAWADPSRR